MSDLTSNQQRHALRQFVQAWLFSSKDRQSAGMPWQPELIEDVMSMLAEWQSRNAVEPPAAPFQDRVHAWMVECFTMPVVSDAVERNHRFLEESLELVQALGCTREEAHMLVDYVFGRPVGEPRQELGGAMVTLAALANVHGIRVTEAADAELARCWTKIEVIRAKQAGKPKHSPLPGAAEPPTDDRKRLAQMDAIIMLGGNIYNAYAALRAIVKATRDAATKGDGQP